MIENGLLQVLKSLTATQRLELIGAAWELVDAEGLPLDECVTLQIDEPPPVPPVPSQGRGSS